LEDQIEHLKKIRGLNSTQKQYGDQDETNQQIREPNN